MGKGKAQQIMSAFILAFHQSIIMLIEKKNNQKGAGKVGLNYPSSMTTLRCVYNTWGKNWVVLAFVWSSPFFTVITDKIFMWSFCRFICPRNKKKPVFLSWWRKRLNASAYCDTAHLIKYSELVPYQTTSSHAELFGELNICTTIPILEEAEFSDIGNLHA